MAPVNYRLFQPGDFEPLYAIEEICFQPPFRFGRRLMKALIENPKSATWIADENGRMAGFAIVEFTPEPEHDTAYIQTIEVSPDHRRKGIGLELMRRLEASAVAAGVALIWLHVDTENDAAIHLYRAEGYQLQGRHENYYARSRAADVYLKQLAAIV
jgi:[ribosomal protein S18]-alanine N-acetyltransferase